VPDSVNERIAKLRGWKYVGLYDAKRPGPGSSIRLHEHPPLFDTDPAAMVELIHRSRAVTIENCGNCSFVAEVQLHNGRTGRTPVSGAYLLCAAVAEAWLAAMEAKGG
jgi:hypothetical protein